MELKNDTSLTAERHRTLNLIQLDKTRVAIGPDEVAHLDSRLTEAWGIRFVEGAKSIAHLLAGVADRGAADRFIAAHDEAAVALSSGAGSPSLQAEKTLFDAMAHPEILGPVTSKRRHIIVDGLAVAFGLIRTLELKGEVLDVGCHAGFVGSLLTEVLGRHATGIDPSAPAIALGRSHPASSPMLNLVEAAIPWNTDMRFDFAIAIDAMPQERAKSVA